MNQIFKQIVMKNYFDETNKYKCSINEMCPEKFNKLIAQKNRCVGLCRNDNK